MFTVVQGIALRGLQGYRVGVEADLGPGLPAFEIVGLPASSVREAKERVRSAIVNSGFAWPRKRIVVNLTPSDWRKDGTGLDLPIAVAVLAASEQIAPLPSDVAFLGELALDGQVRTYRGLWTAMICAMELGSRRIILPLGADLDVPRTMNSELLPTPSLIASLACGRGESISGYGIPTRAAATRVAASTKVDERRVDMCEVAGQETVKRALEIAAAGRHHILLSGHPGAGKSMLAERLATLLPALSDGQSLQVRQIYSVAGMESTLSLYAPPFRTPHYSVSLQGLLGGGANPMPGEVSLAHQGVLFLDEFPEFSRAALEGLRQPLETRSITLSRSSYHYSFPADFQLIAAMNPCPCGYRGSSSGRLCTCDHRQLERYRAKLSGPIMDRIEMTVWVDSLDISTMMTDDRDKRETSEVIRERVIRARAFAQDRDCVATPQQTTPRTPAQVLADLVMEQDARTLLFSCAQKASLSARSLFKVARVARTIADLCEQQTVRKENVVEALLYRFYQ